MASNASESGRRPRIGVTTYLDRARWSVWDRRAAVLPTSYVDMVVRAGGVPVLLPVLADGADEVLDGVDGLVLSGGGDLGPGRYGAAPHPETGGVSRDRDAWELRLASAALARDVPVLGVCRGMQVLDVALGGTLHQHLAVAHRASPGAFADRVVRLAEGSRLARVLGPSVRVRCHHHQAVDALGDGLEAVGWADDGTVEAVERSARRFVVGVQWHPEEDADGAPLCAALVEAARAEAVGAAEGRRR